MKKKEGEQTKKVITPAEDSVILETMCMESGMYKIWTNLLWNK